MSTKTVTLLLGLLLALTVPFTIAAAPQDNPACKASKKIGYLIDAIQSPNHYTSGATFMLEGEKLWLGVESNAMNSWLAWTGSGLYSRAQVVDALKSAGWEYRGKNFFDQELWVKPKNWKNPCKGGGGGGLSLQHAAAYIWWLVILAIAAMLAAARLFGGRVIPVPIK